MPKVTIAKIEGRARGGGNEIALAMDMCFAAVGKAIFGQPEVAVGLVPGGGSTQRLPRVIGRGRALEVLLGCDDFSAELTERYGYINRALPADELTPFVERLAHRIASFPAHTVAHVKAAVDLGAFSSLAEGLLVEAYESDLSVASEVTQARVAEALKLGAETYEGELEMEFLSRLLPDRLARAARRIEMCPAHDGEERGLHRHAELRGRTPCFRLADEAADEAPAWPSDQESEEGGEHELERLLRVHLGRKAAQPTEKGVCEEAAELGPIPLRTTGSIGPDRRDH